MERFHLRDLDVLDHQRRTRALLDLVRRAAPFAEVREVGSTVLEGCIGKGDLDVLARCPAPDFPRLVAALDEVLSFNPEQLHDDAYRGYVWLVDGVEAGAVQATIEGGRYDSFVDFQERLTAEPVLIEAYNTLKRRFDGEPMDAYRTAKAAFIERVLAGPEVPAPVPWAWAFRKRTPTFTAETVPAGLRRDHRTKEGVWGRIVVEEGRLAYRIGGSAHELLPGVVGGIPPTVLHSVEPVGTVRFHVEFLYEA